VVDAMVANYQISIKPKKDEPAKFRIFREALLFTGASAYALSKLGV